MEDHQHSGGMGQRGVTRPMAMHEHHPQDDAADRHTPEGAAEHTPEEPADDAEHTDAERPSAGNAQRFAAAPDDADASGSSESEEGGEGDDKTEGDEDEDGDAQGAMSDDERRDMLHMHHRQTLWIPWTLIILGVWLVLAPFTFGYLTGPYAHPSGGRGVWFYDHATHDTLRAWLVTGSDILSGLVLLVLGWRTLTPDRPVSWWGCCGVGIWLTLAPVLFWSPTAAAYLNDTLVGMLIIALTILIPGMPNMIMYMQMGPPRPPGWSYNPSSWPQRWIMIVTGFLGFIVSRWLAAYQMGYIDRIPEPFFGESTQRVLNSGMSHLWPISDAALGSLSYTFEFLMGYMGSPARWRTMPWMVAFFGILVIPLGLVHILLVTSQPVVVGHWCTLCLLAAAIMLPMLPLEVDEVIAMGQHMVQARRRGDRGGSLWTIFWKGGSAEGCEPDERSPELQQFAQHPWRVTLASIWGVSFPWTLIACSVIGIWFMFQPWALGNSGMDAAAIWRWGGWGMWEVTTADVIHLGGALILTTSVIAMGEVVRAGRLLNILLGAIVAGLPWLAGGEEFTGNLIASIGGGLVILLSIPRGPKRETYGLWDRYVW